MRIFGLALGSLLVWGCGGSGDGGGGAGGGGLEGDEECVAAQEYINGDPCASDSSLDASEWQIPLFGCMDENDSKLCVNCIKFRRTASETCVLDGDCTSECTAMHNS